MWTKSIMYPLIIFLFCLFVFSVVGIVARPGQARRRCHCAPPLCLLSGYTGFFSPFYVKWSHQRVCQLMLNTGKTEYLLFASAVLYAPRGSGTGGGGGGDSSNAGMFVAAHPLLLLLQRWWETKDVWKNLQKHDHEACVEICAAAAAAASDVDDDDDHHQDDLRSGCGCEAGTISRPWR